jgi:hypothetical protein
MRLSNSAGTIWIVAFDLAVTAIAIGTMSSIAKRALRMPACMSFLLAGNGL